LLSQVGCPGDVDTVVVTAHPDVNGGRKALEYLFHDQKTFLSDITRDIVGPDGKTYECSPALVAEQFTSADLGKVFPSGDVGLNNYEACLRFVHESNPTGKAKYFGGGAGEYDSAHDVLTQAFGTFVWTTGEMITQPGKAPVPGDKIVAIIARY
jgi:hypothetical protein